MYRLIAIDIMFTAFKRSNTSIREFNQEELDMVQDAVIKEMIIKKNCPYCGMYQGEETISVCIITLITGKRMTLPAATSLPKGKVDIKDLRIQKDLNTSVITLIPHPNSEISKYQQKAIQDFVELLRDNIICE